MVTEEFARQFATDWIAAWNSHDLEEILSHYADDLHFSSPLIPATMENGETTLMGKPAVAAYWGRALGRFPDLKFELIDLYVGAESLLITYHSVANIRAAEWFEFDQRGQVNRAVAHYTG